MATIRNRHAAAFTLFELLATLAIIATLLGAAMPTMQAFMARNRGQQGMHSLRESLLHSRQHAMDTGEKATWSTQQIDESTSMHAFMQEGFVAQITAGKIPIVFHPDGTSTDALVELTDANNTLLGTLLVIGSTGAILAPNSGG